MAMRVATWNVNSLRVRLPQVLEWLARCPVDVLALQETKLTDPDFPHREFEAQGYHSIASGQKTYNGVALLSRAPSAAVMADIPGLEDAPRRVLAATINGLRVVNLYVPNGQSVGSEKYTYKLRWLGALDAWLRTQVREHERLVIVGDFNIAPEDRDVHDPAKWAGSVHVSEPERAALRGLINIGLVDVFRLFDQPRESFSWWDYRGFSFRRNNGLRIDLILAGAGLAAHCTASHIDAEPRRAERPSDHTPVIATFDI
jgi:exodeoxyribonuclease III